MATVPLPVSVDVDEEDVLRIRPFKHEDTCYICLGSLSSGAAVQGTLNKH